MKHAGGRPVKFTPEQFKIEFENYIKYCVENDKFANLAGFAVYGKFNMDTYYEYKDNRKEFSEAIKKIEQTLMDVSIQKGVEKSNAFMIFYMKNKFGWRDQQDIDLTSNKKELKHLTEIDEFFEKEGKK